MMSAKEIATLDEEEGAEEEGATSVGSTRGRFAVSYAALL